jgi:hypothetical protein
MGIVVRQSPRFMLEPRSERPESGVWYCTGAPVSASDSLTVFTFVFPALRSTRVLKSARARTEARTDVSK